MNILYKVAIQGLKRNPVRTATTIAGVILATALFTAMTTFSISLQTYMVNGAGLRYGSWHVDVFDVPESFVEEQAQSAEVETVASCENIGYAALEGVKNEAKPYLFIAGFDDSTTESVPIRVYSGRMPENDREVVVPAHLGTDGGVRYDIGDRITLAVGRRVAGDRALNQHMPYQRGGETLVDTVERSYTVVGICQRPAMEERSAPGYTLITRAEGTSLSKRYTAFIRLKHPSRVHTYAREVGERFDVGTNDEVLRFLGLTNDRVFNSLLYSVGGVLAALVMVGSIFLIYNAFNISLGERTHQFGILMSVGATRRQLRDSVLFEGVCIGAIGIPLGILLGLPGIKLVLALVSENFANVLYDGVPLDMVLSFPALGAAALISLVTLLISAWLPARRAAAVPVMECIRQLSDIRAEPRNARIPPFIEHIFGLYGALAIKNFKRERRRFRSVVLSLSLSVILTVAADAFGRDVKSTAQRADVYTTYDIKVSMADADDAAMTALYNRLKDVEAVTNGNYQRLSRYTARVASADLSPAYWDAMGCELSRQTEALSAEVQFVDDAAFAKTAQAAGVEAKDYMDGDRMLALAVMLANDGQTHELDDFAELFTDPSSTAALCSRTDGESIDVELDFRRFVPEDTPPVSQGESDPYMLRIVVPWSLRDRLPSTEVAAQGLTFCSDNPGLSAAIMQQTLDGMSEDGRYVALNVHAMLEQSRNILFVADLFSAIFITMITLIAIANVYNTVSTNLKLRRRALAMLRSVGMSDGDFSKMMGFECLLYSMKTLLWSLPLSALVAWLIHRLLGSEDLSFALPWQGMLLSSAGIVLIVFATTHTVARKLMRENVIDALRDEMT